MGYITAIDHITGIDAIAGGVGRVVGPGSNGLVGEWSMRKQVSTNGVLIDYSGNGHHGWYGGVKRALIGDTTYGDRGLILGGVSGNYASVPDAAGNRPIGDQWYLGDTRCADYSSATGNPRIIQARWGGAGSRSARFGINDAEGKLEYRWSANGTDTVATVESTAVLETVVANTVRVQVAVTHDVDNGAVGNDVKFWWRVPGGSWAQLGSTVTTAGVTSVFAGTAAWECGSLNVGTSAFMIGTIYAARMGTGLVLDTGTTLSVDFTTQAQGTRTFVCSTGQTVTVNQSADTAAMPTRLYHGGTSYLWYPGTDTNCCTVPDVAGLRPTTELDVRFGGTPAGAGTTRSLVSKYGAAGNRAVRFELNTSNYLALLLSVDGTAIAGVDSGAAYAAGANGFRATWRASDGRVQFFTCTDYAPSTGAGTWVQLGTDQTIAIAGIYASTQTLDIGGRTTSLATYSGVARGAQWILTIAGTPACTVDFTADASYNATHTGLTAVTGQTVTINRSATGLKSTVVAENVAVFDGVDDYIEVDDHARLDFAATESFTAVLRTRKATWNVSVSQALFAKQVSTAAASTGYSLVTFNAGAGVGVTASDGTNRGQDAESHPTAGAEAVIVGRRNAGVLVAAFVDGTGSAGSTDSTTATLANAYALRIGRYADSGTAYADMQFYSAALFRRALSAAQILRLNSEM